MAASRSMRAPVLPALAGLLLVLMGPVAAAAPVSEQVRETEPTARAPRVMTDMRGRGVTVPAEINGIIALGANSLRLLTYFDSVDKVIAVEDTGPAREKTVHGFFHLATYRIAYPGLRELPSIGSSENHEAIIAAAPDIVFSSTVDVGRLDQLQETLAIPVFAIDADVELNDPERFLDQFRIVGRALGEEARVEELVAGIEGILDDLAARAALVSAQKTAYAGGMMYYGPADLLRTTGDYVPFDDTGTLNVMPTNPAGNRQPYMTEIEELIAADPDYIFIDAANVGLSMDSYRSHRAVLDERVTAFANRDVYTTLVYKYYGTNWENQIINIYYVGTVVHPELFADVVMQEKAEEIWRLFFNVELDYRSVIDVTGAGLGRSDWW